jgi:hypothetical protein
VVLLAAAVPALGQATYSYQGNNYNNFSAPGPTFNATMSISGSFDLTLALPPNLALTQLGLPQLTDFNFSNGAFTFTPATAEVCDFSVATGPNGAIVQWRIFLRQSGVALGANQFTAYSQRSVGARDEGDFILATGNDCQEGLPAVELAEVIDDPGVWTTGTEPVPALPQWAWAVLLALLTVGGARALRSKQRAQMP